MMLSILAAAAAFATPLPAAGQPPEVAPVVVTYEQAGAIRSSIRPKVAVEKFGQLPPETSHEISTDFGGDYIGLPPLPEPTSLALLLSGFTMVSMAIRRRRFPPAVIA
jgi:hypothetical protein